MESIQENESAYVCSKLFVGVIFDESFFLILPYETLGKFIEKATWTRQTY